LLKITPDSGYVFIFKLDNLWFWVISSLGSKIQNMKMGNAKKEIELEPKRQKIMSIQQSHICDKLESILITVEKQMNTG
jgi:hypothetical protein